jgi:hypothetical protein
MSFVVLSSEQQNNGKSGQLSVEKPYSFTNYFQEPIRVPKNSRVALQSIRFQDAKTVQVGLNHNLHLFIGEELDRDTDKYMEDTVSFPIISELVSETGSLGDSNSFREGGYSPDDFPIFFQNVLNKYMMHPEFEGKQTVAVKRNSTTNKFEGFDITFDQFNSSGTSQISENWAPWNTKTGNFSFSNGSLKRTASKSGGGGVIFDKRCVAIGTDYPLSAAHGECEFEWVGTHNWRVGLTRPTTGGDENTRPFGFSSKGDINVFFDYCVEHINDVIYIYHMAKKQGKTRMVQINYDNASNSSFSGGSYPATRTGHSAIRFRVRNEKLELHLKKGGSYVPLLVTEDTSNLNQCAKAINQNQWYLYPKIQLANQNQQMKLVTFTTHGKVVYGQRSFFSGCVNGVFPNGPKISADIDFRNIFDVGIAQTRTYKDVNGSGGVNVNVTMILGDDLLYDPRTTSIFPSNTRRTLFPAANTTRMLGFSPFSNIDSTYKGPSANPSTIIYSSLSEPNFYDVSQPLLVRLNGLPITTFNGAKSGTSKVIYSIAQYQSDEGGVVYVIPPELIYIDIGNTEEILISQLGIDLVNIFERYSTAITGKSVITLCIKPKEEKY